MGLVVNHNILAGHTSRFLNAHYRKLSDSTRRLSSGLRVETAADDAAGLAIRELMRSDVATMNQGVRNANDAISMIQTADGALQVIDEKLIRMKELAEQAATGTYDSTQRMLLNEEFQAMAAEIDRIANATEFNGIKLLDGSRAGTHGGDKMLSSGALKVHFGTGNASAGDYYYVHISDASTKGLFEGTREVLSVTGFTERLPRTMVPVGGDAEGQNVMALPNGNALVLVNNHSDRSIRMFEYTPEGTLVRQQRIPQPPTSTGVMQPKESIVLPDGNIAISYYSWGEDAFRLVTYDDAWNMVSNEVVPAGGGIGGFEDMAMSVAGGSLLAGGVVGGNVVLAMTDDDGSNPRPPVVLGPGAHAASTNLGNKHLVVAHNAGSLEGYFVDGAGTSSGPLDLGEGARVRLVSFGDKAVMTYSHADLQTGRISSYARVVNADGSIGEETRLNSPDATRDNSVEDIAILRNPDGSLSEQVLISWKNSADNGTLLAGSFAVVGGVVSPAGAPNMEFVSNITGNGVGPSNIAVLNDGTIISDWQEDISMGGVDNNALGIFKVNWGEKISVKGDEPDLSIETQGKAQRILPQIERAIAVKDNIRASLGAFQNRLENTITNLSVQAENLQASESRISDVDVAEEMTDFTRSQILSQSATAMLSQVNALPEMVVRLISAV